MPAHSAEDEQAADLQTQTDTAVLKTEAADVVSNTQRNQRAAARRFNSRNKDKRSSSSSAL